MGSSQGTVCIKISNLQSVLQMVYYKVHKRRSIWSHILNDMNQRQGLSNSLFKAGFVYKHAQVKLSVANSQ